MAQWKRDYWAANRALGFRLDSLARVCQSRVYGSVSLYGRARERLFVDIYRHEAVHGHMLVHRYRAKYDLYALV